MGCNCTANLRADIIKRFFANQFNGKEFALELIRIVECQQDVMSRELEDWFKVWFRFPQDMLEEFLACVMKRQATMSDNLQKVIRARFFPTDQRMADDFIRVVLCSCCPAICGTDIDIVGIYIGDPVSDGWYLRQDGGASADTAEIVYIESNVITETRVCESKLADYGHPNGENEGYEAPHFYSPGGEWFPLIEVFLRDNGGFEYEFRIFHSTEYDFGATAPTTLVQYSTDGGTTWIDGGSDDIFPNPTSITFNTGTDTFIYRTIVTLANGCQFYNPAPDTGSPSYGIYYGTFQPAGGIAFLLQGEINGITPLDDPANDWVDILNTMVEPYQSVAGRLGGIGVDFQSVDGGSGFEGAFYMQIITPLGNPPTELGVIIDGDLNPVDTTPQGVANVIKNYVATFTFINTDPVYMEAFMIFGAKVGFDPQLIDNPATEQYIVLLMEDYQLKDPAFTFEIEINALNVQIFITTAIPMTDIVFDQVGAPSPTVVPLIEI